MRSTAAYIGVDLLTLGPGGVAVLKNVKTCPANIPLPKKPCTVTTIAQK